MKKSVVVLSHVGFCCAYAIIYYYQSNFTVNRGDMERYMRYIQLVYYVQPIIFYVSYFLTYLFTKNKKNFMFVVLFFLIVLLLPSFVGMHHMGYSFFTLTVILPIAFCGALFYLGIDWYQKKEQKKELERQNLQSELKLLKNQVNPHFLFNTLNNIDRLIASNPDKASVMLVGLSGMMRYMIYDTNANISPLSQELQQIRNYIDLQEMQYANPDLVAYSVEGSQEGIEVAPMLFIPFIENAFKHCTDKTVQHAIRFSFRMEDKRIHFESVNIANPAHHIEKDSTGGIGLETVKRRLELLYPGKHKLQIDEKNDLFCVSLTVETQ